MRKFSFADVVPSWLRRAQMSLPEEEPQSAARNPEPIVSDVESAAIAARKAATEERQRQEKLQRVRQRRYDNIVRSEINALLHTSSPSRHTLLKAYALLRNASEEVARFCGTTLQTIEKELRHTIAADLNEWFVRFEYSSDSRALDALDDFFLAHRTWVTKEGIRITGTEFNLLRALGIELPSAATRWAVLRVWGAAHMEPSTTTLSRLLTPITHLHNLDVAELARTRAILLAAVKVCDAMLPDVASSPQAQVKYWDETDE
jgi:hypothetical protein